MNILHVINTLSSGGAEKHLLTLASRQKDLGAGVKVAFLREHVPDCPSLRPQFADRGIELFDLQAGPRYDCAFPARLAGLVAREKPDVIHTHQPRADMAGAVARHAAPGALWVCSVHDVHDASWSARYALPVLDRVWRRPDAVIAISEAVKQWLTEGRRLPAGRIHVIEYGIETGELERPLRNLRAEWGLGAALVAGSIGRLERRKGHDVLIRAMPAVAKRYPQARLLIAGHDPDGYGAELQALTRDLNLCSRVTFTGFQPDVPSFLAALDVFVFLSRSEGFGQVVVEAMAASRPVIVSDIAPLNAIVDHGRAGLVTPPGDPEAAARAVVSVLSNRQKARDLGERASAHVRERYSAGRMAAETLSLYEESMRAREAA